MLGLLLLPSFPCLESGAFAFLSACCSVVVIVGSLLSFPPSLQRRRRLPPLPVFPFLLFPLLFLLPLSNSRGRYQPRLHCFCFGKEWHQRVERRMEGGGEGGRAGNCLRLLSIPNSLSLFLLPECARSPLVSLFGPSAHLESDARVAPLKAGRGALDAESGGLVVGRKGRHSKLLVWCCHSQEPSSPAFLPLEESLSWGTHTPTLKTPCACLHSCSQNA